MGWNGNLKSPIKHNNFFLAGFVPFLALTGCSAALLGELMDSPWGFALPIVIAGAFLVVAYIGTVKNGDFGMTTEEAALLTVIIEYVLLWLNRTRCSLGYNCFGFTVF